MPAAPRDADFLFSSEDLALQHRRAAICGLRERGILAFEPLAETASARIAKNFLPGAGILSGTLAGLRQDGILRSVDASDDIFLGINVRGRSLAKQNGQEIEFGDGDAIMLSCAEGSFAIFRPTQVEFVGVRVPRAAIASRVQAFEGRMRRLPRDTAVLPLLINYAKAAPVLLAECANRSAILGNHLYDLIALTMGPCHETVIAFDRSVRAARLQAIKSDIAANLHDSALTTAVIAGHHRVTPRYIQKLFAEERTTFTHYILKQRLERAPLAARSLLRRPKRHIDSL